MLKSALLIVPPILALALGVMLPQFGVDSNIAWTVAITGLTAVWWVTEALPIPATSLLPFCLFPIFGVLTAGQAASALGANIIMLLVGAFILSMAIEKSGVHKRLALGMIRMLSGGSGTFPGWRLVVAFMISAAALSMWIANAATTLMLMPVAIAILHHVKDAKLSVAVLLGVAYAASIGGAGTLIGTPPNIVFAGIYQEYTGEEYSFLKWMKTGVPIVVCSIPVMALWLTRNVRGSHTFVLPEIGAWTKAEVRVLMIFAMAVVLWITRAEPFGGWSGLLHIEGASDATVALFAVLLMFMTPDGRGGRLLDWETANRIPWGMLLLFAGGICIAAAFTSSGLSRVIGDGLSGLSTLSLFAMLLVVCLSVSFLTEMTSNTATATLLMPVLAAAAAGTGAPPQLLMVPAAISASCAFMLPVATAPNAIAYATGDIKMSDMVREGFVLNILLAFVVAGVCYLTLD